MTTKEFPKIRQTLFIVDKNRKYLFDVNQNILIKRLKRMIIAAADLNKVGLRIFHEGVEYTLYDESALDELFPNLNLVEFYIQYSYDQVEDLEEIIDLKLCHHCNLHPGKYPYFYCFTCGRSICSGCLLSGDHTGHETKEKYDYLQESKNLVELLFKDLKDIFKNRKEGSDDAVNELKAKVKIQLFPKLGEIIKQIEENMLKLIIFYLEKEKGNYNIIENNVKLLKSHCEEGLNKLKKEIVIEDIMVDENIFLTFDSKFKEIGNEKKKFKEDIEKYKQFSDNLNLIQSIIEKTYKEIYDILVKYLTVTEFEDIKNKLNKQNINVIDKKKIFDKLLSDVKRRGYVDKDNKDKKNIPYSNINANEYYLRSKIKNRDKDDIMEIENKEDYDNNDINHINKGRNNSKNIKKENENYIEIDTTNNKNKNIIRNKNDTNNNINYTVNIIDNNDNIEDNNKSNVKRNLNIIESGYIYNNMGNSLYNNDKDDTNMNINDNNIGIQHHIHIIAEPKQNINSNIKKYESMVEENIDNNESSNIEPKINKNISYNNKNVTVFSDMVKNSKASKDNNISANINNNANNNPNNNMTVNTNIMNLRSGNQKINVGYISANNNNNGTENINTNANINNNSTISNNEVEEEEVSINQRFNIICNVVPSLNQIVIYNVDDDTITRKNISFSILLGISHFLPECAWVNCNNKLYILGGIDDTNKSSNIFIEYDPLKNSLKRLPNSIYSHSRHSLFSYKNHIYVIGGDNLECEKYDIEKNEWNILPNLLFKQIYPMLYVHKDVLYSFFGIDDNFKKSDNVQKLNLNSNNGNSRNRWIKINIKKNKCNLCVYGCGIAKINENCVLFLGGMDDDGLRDDAILFDFSNLTAKKTEYSLEEKAYFKDSALLRLDQKNFGNFSFEERNNFLKINFQVSVQKMNE